MASASFRDSMNSLGWSRRDPDIPVNTSQQSGLLSSIQSLNPFGNRSYVQLPVTESSGAPLPASNRRDEEEGWLACTFRPNLCYINIPHILLDPIRPPGYLSPHGRPPPHTLSYPPLPPPTSLGNMDSRPVNFHARLRARR